MAIFSLPAFQRRVAHSFVVRLDGVSIGFAMRWNRRTNSWYMTLSRAGTDFLQGRRVTPGTFVDLAAFDLGVPGRLFVAGPDPYRQDDLGASLVLLYIDGTEVASAARLGLPTDKVA